VPAHKEEGFVHPQGSPAVSRMQFEGANSDFREAVNFGTWIGNPRKIFERQGAY
jgi:hypothetical protein